MKHTFKVILVSAMVGTQAFAQKGFDLSINSGLQTTTLINVADQAAGPELDFKQKINVPFGIGAGYTFSKHLGAAIDVIHSRQGQAYKGLVSPGTDPKLFIYQVNRMAAMDNIPLSGHYTASVALNSIKIPFLLRYTGNAEKTVWFNSFIGPQIDIISSVAMRVNDKDISFTGMNIKPADAYNRMTIDGVLGIGAGFNLAKNLVITANLRLEYGISDIEKKATTFRYAGGVAEPYYTDGRGANHSASGGLMVSLRYKFVKEEKVVYRKGVKPHLPAKR